MTVTPWGNADELRARRLRPGPARAPHLVERNQRERLFAATVAMVDEHGYEAMRVEDLVAISGVSRSAFYRHFSNKQDCFLATFDGILATIGEAIENAVASEQAWDRRLGAALDALIALVVEQPAAARLCLVEAYAAGPEATDRLDAAVERVERLVKGALADSPERADMPAELVRAMVGGVHQVVHTRLRRDQEHLLPDLAPELLEWALGYPAPAEPLRRPRIRPARPASGSADGDAARSRLIAGITATAAERGYPEMTVVEVATAGRVSLTTFYANFETKEDAFVAAVEHAGEHMLAVAGEACEAAPDWRRGARDALDEVFGLLAADPAMARVVAIEAYAAGPNALEQRDIVLADFQGLLEARVKPPARGSALTLEAISGAVLTLVYRQARRQRPQRLRELTPAATYVTLSPLLGADDALVVASAGDA